MKLFEAVLPGFNGGTDNTDHLVAWVAAPCVTDVEAVLPPGTVVGYVPISLKHADYELPTDTEALRQWGTK